MILSLKNIIVRMFLVLLAISIALHFTLGAGAVSHFVDLFTLLAGAASAVSGWKSYLDVRSTVREARWYLEGEGVSLSALEARKLLDAANSHL